MPVEDEHALLRVARHAHQHPVGAVLRAVLQAVLRGVFRVRIAGAREGDLDGAVAAAGPMPDLRGGVDAELGDRGLGGHGFLATPQ